MKISIIGGAIGGLASAIALQRAGHEVTVFEKQPALGEVGAGLSLWVNAIRALDYLGVGAEVRAQALPELAGALRTNTGRVIMATSNQGYVDRFGDGLIVMHRKDLMAILQRAFTGSVQLGRSCTALEERGEQVIARFADGTEHASDLLIGADGVHSVVRAHLHGDVPARHAGYFAWRAVVPFAGVVDGGESWGRGARFGIAPLKGGRVYWFACVNGRASTQLRTKQAVRVAFKGWHHPISELIDATQDDALLINDIVDRDPPPFYSRGRVVLVGDAAHATTPNLGQGACQALEDAVVLAECIKNNPLKNALPLYDRLRIPRTRDVVLQSRRIGDVGQWSNPAAIFVRNFAVKVMSAAQTRNLEKLIGYDPRTAHTRSED